MRRNLRMAYVRVFVFIAIPLLIVFMVIAGSLYIYSAEPPFIKEAELWLRKFGLNNLYRDRVDAYLASVDEGWDIDTQFVGKCRFKNSVRDGYIYFGRVKQGGYHVRGVSIQGKKIIVVESTCPLYNKGCEWGKVFGVIKVENNRIVNIKLYDGLVNQGDRESVVKLIYYLTGLYAYRRGEIGAYYRALGIFAEPGRVIFAVLKKIMG